jgi:hypothetical protein
VDSQRIAAERALLGAVLLDPAGQEHVLDYVEADDFLRPWHAQVLAAMERVRRGGRQPGPREAYAELRNDPDLPADVAMDGVLVTDLMAAAPRPGHASAYAAAVVESGIRQRLWIAGSRVRQVADTGELGYALGQAAEAGREVAACRDRWQRLPRAWRPEIRHLADEVSARPVAARSCGRDAEAAGSGLLQPHSHARISVHSGAGQTYDVRSTITIRAGVTLAPAPASFTPRMTAQQAYAIYSRRLHGPQAKAKLRRVHDPQVRPLNERVERWRREGHQVPYADLDSGGVRSRVVFLHESPGHRLPTAAGWSVRTTTIRARSGSGGSAVGPG